MLERRAEFNRSDVASTAPTRCRSACNPAIRTPLGDVCSGRLDVNTIERLPRRHEETIAPVASETHVRAGFGKTNHPDTIAVGREDLDARTSTRPDISVCVAADAVCCRRRFRPGDIELHETFAVA